MTYLWTLRPYFRQVAGQLVIGALGGIVMNTAVVLPPILLGRAIDSVVGLERGESTLRDVAISALLVVGGSLLYEGPRVIKRWHLMTANARIRGSLRSDALRGTLSRPLADLHRTTIGDQLARIVGDVEVLSVGLREFTIETWDTLLFSTSFVVAMFVIDPELSAIALAPVPIAVVIANASGRWISRRTAVAREANGGLTASIQELLAGFRVLRVFGRSQAATKAVQQRSEEYAERNLAALRLTLGLRPMYSTLMILGVLWVIWQGGANVISGAMSLGTFIAYVGLFTRFVERGFRIPQMINSIQSGGAAYHRLAPLLAPPLPLANEPPFASFDSGRMTGIDDAGEAPRRHDSGAYGVSLCGVTFVYPGVPEPVLRDLSLEVAPGDLVAVTGPVGSGKSALARVLLGVYPLAGGSVTFTSADGSAAPVRRPHAIGYLPQQPTLFSGSIVENVRMGNERSPESFGAAVSIAGLTRDLSELPEGAEAQVGELGVRISGGQRQRVGLARAINAYAPDLPGLLVLDDPFSAIDVETEAEIVSALRTAFGPSRSPTERVTIVLCSQRLAAFPHADQVVVLNDGCIEESGTHRELLGQGGLYARIYDAQVRSEMGVVRPSE